MSKELIKLLRAEIARTVDLDMMHHNAANRIEELEREVESLKASMYGHYELEAERDAIKADSDAATYYDDSDGRRWSLRSTPEGADVAQIAEAFGGGGHKHAAGFRMTREEAIDFEIHGGVN